MATKSFLKNIEIRNSKMGNNFEAALRNCESNTRHQNTIPRECKELKGEAVKDFFHKSLTDEQ